MRNNVASTDRYTLIEQVVEAIKDNLAAGCCRSPDLKIKENRGIWFVEVDVTINVKRKSTQGVLVSGSGIIESARNHLACGRGNRGRGRGKEDGSINQVKCDDLSSGRIMTINQHECH